MPPPSNSSESTVLRIREELLYTTKATLAGSKMLALTFSTYILDQDPDRTASNRRRSMDSKTLFKYKRRKLHQEKDTMAGFSTPQKSS
ncbi:MAG: hypothetical protein Q9188_001474 [Gyalolechia gomerana]